MRPIVVTVGPFATASANNIAASQTVTAPNFVTLNGSAASGGVATLDQPRRIIITSAGNDSAKTFAVTGTNWSGSLISEVIQGANAGAALSTLDYLTITSIKPSATTAAAITVGTTSTAATMATSAWINFDDYGPGDAAIAVVVSGTITHTIEYTFDDPNSSTNPVLPQNVTWQQINDTGAVGATGNVVTNLALGIPAFIRLTIGPGSTGSAVMTIRQSGGSSKIE